MACHKPLRTYLAVWRAIREGSEVELAFTAHGKEMGITMFCRAVKDKYFFGTRLHLLTSSSSCTIAGV